MTNIEKNMAEAAQSQDIASVVSPNKSGEMISPVEGMSPELFKKEAEHIRLTLAKQEDQGIQNLPPKPLVVGQEVNGKVVSQKVLENAQLWDTQRQEAAAKLLGKELSDKQKEELIEAHWESAGEKGLDEGHLAGVYNLTRGQIRREAEKLPSFTTEERRKLFEAGLVGVPDYLKEEAKQNSEIQDAIEVVLLDAKLSPSRRAKIIASQPDYQQLLDNSKNKINEVLLPANPQDAEELKRVFRFVREDISRICLEAIQPVPQADSDSWYPSPKPKAVEERINTVNEALGINEETGEFNYKETFWNYGETTLKRTFKDPITGQDPDINALREKYKGVASYIAARAATAIVKELKGQLLQPDSADSTKEEFGDFYLSDIKRGLKESKGERERFKREKRKRATAEERLKYNDWREKFDFNWAETAEELDDSVEDWLDYFQQALPLEADESVYQEVQKGLSNALSSLEKARNRIGLETNDVRVFALREKIIGHVTTIAGARLLESKGGFEYFIKLRTDFASNYNPYYDAIYKKKGFAIMADKISENEGEIYRGGAVDKKKPLSGDTKTHRGALEREIIRYGATHELYITDDDVEAAVLGEEKIRREVGRLGLPPHEAEKVVQERLKERLGRYDWGEDDVIEGLLLKDKRGFDRTQALTDPQKKAEAEARWKTRTEFFENMKKMLDKEDGLDGKSPDERRKIVRQRIKDKVTQEGYQALLQEINALPDQESQDRALWKWVRDFNKKRVELRKEGSNDEPWFPSHWDMERLSIQRPEDLIDRALSKKEFNAMVEEVEDSYKDLTDEQISRKITDEFEAEVQREIQAKNLSPQDAVKEFKRLKQERQEEIDGKIEDVLFQRKEREARAIRNFNLNRAQDKFLELEARWGGLTTRVINKNGEAELRTIYSLASEIIKAKIDKEAQGIEDKVNVWKANFMAANPGITTEQLKEATIKQKRLFRRHATFAATLGLREIGIANDLPIWEYYYYGDVAEIGAFAPLVGYTDEDKRDLPALLDSGRREMEAVFYFLAQQHMDGKMLDVRDAQGLLIEVEEKDKDGNMVLVQKEAHEEKWVRPRVINEGGVLKLRDLFESRFMISTSGGVEVTDLIYRIADLGVFDELWEHGCLDKREWQGFRKRRNKWELREQTFFNTREWADPLTHVQRLTGAANAKKFLTGGEVQGQGHVPGVLIEPMSGAYKYRDMFYSDETWIQGASYRDKFKLTDKEHARKLRELLTNAEITGSMTDAGFDKLVEIGAGIMKPLIDYMNARRYVMNRAGLAPKNWKYDNELIVNAYIDNLFNEEDMGGDKLGYAPEGRSKVSAKIFKDILKTSTYHILVEGDRRKFYSKAKEKKAQITQKRDEIVRRGLPAEVRITISNRETKLLALHTTPENIAKEKKRLEDQYYDTQLRKEFVGEWPARLLDN
ncbi:hypothetical protein HYS95_03205 [Candidatus Daviesbacteria bacterium]|nr:hypothetical protein [Candidatus Daviesbacteria bacterium]